PGQLRDGRADQQGPAAASRHEAVRARPQSRRDARKDRLSKRSDGTDPVPAADRSGAAVPLLASPPWINKYYVMDLAPGRSFLEWAVQHGRTVFAISYRNPDASMRDTGMDDYLVQGPRAALDVVEDITGSSVIDVVGLCLGGALTAITAAYLARMGDSRVGSLTLLN